MSLKKLCAMALTSVMLVAGLSGCKKKTEEDATTTTVDSSSSNIVPAIVVTSPTAIARIARTSGETKTTTPEFHDFKAKKDFFDSIQTQSTIAGCMQYFIIPAYGPASPQCYGASMNIKKHPDDALGSGTPALTAAGSSWTAGTGWFLPPGDSGIWQVTAPNGEACMAAKMNYESINLSSRVDAAMNMMNAMACIMKVQNGGTLPTTISNVSLSTTLNSNLTGTGIANVSTATINVSGNVTGIVLKGTKSDGRAFYYKLTNTKANTTNTENSGVLSGYEQFFGNSVEMKEAFSITYQNDASYFTAEVRMRQANNIESETHTTPIFSATTGKITYYDSTTYTSTYGSPGAMGGGNYVLMKLNKSNGTGTIKYAWQAGIGDSNTRVFQANTTKTTTTTGWGFFGFGPNMVTGQTNSTLGSIDGMFCAWTSPANGLGNGLDNPTARWKAGVMQAQSFAEQQIVDGGVTKYIFVPVTNNVAYAPTTSCNYDTSATWYSNPADRMSMSYDNGSTWSNFNSGNSLTNQLINQSGLGTNGYSAIPSITVPTYTIQ